MIIGLLLIMAEDKTKEVDKKNNELDSGNDTSNVNNNRSNNRNDGLENPGPTSLGFTPIQENWINKKFDGLENKLDRLD